VTGGWAAIEWKNVEAGSAIEAALYRVMPMPVSNVLGLRPPKEAVPLLGELIKKQPTAELYSLRAQNEEAALDFNSAEADWKKVASTATDREAAQFALADFYHRRLRPKEEIDSLAGIARSPLPAKEKLFPVTRQSSWRAFERTVTVIAENALPANVSEQNYKAWIARYPDQATVYARYFQFLLDRKSFAEADKLISQYHSAFKNDDVFPVKARALLAYKKGSVEQGLAIYDAQFQPLWPQELIQSYFDLMRETRSTRKFLDRARAALQRNPDDLNAAARIFYFYQRQGKTDVAQQTLVDYRAHKERRNGKFNSLELFTLARLNEGVRAYPEAARCYYSLYNTTDSPEAPQQALAGLAGVLLDAPEQNVRFGTGDLSMYRDIGSMDTGPGFLNGILSLLLNTASPQFEYSEEEQRAVPYFHRAAAAELVRLVDSRFPNAAQRPSLHARLLETYSTYGESDAVIRDGRQFLTSFPEASQRQQVALLMADAYARTNRSSEEFALYDELLSELAKKADGVPLGEEIPAAPDNTVAASAPADADGDAPESETSTPEQQQQPERRAFALAGGQNEAQQEKPGVRSSQYSSVLERYLSRLVSLDQIPQALTVLRKEIDRNPNDPGLYERLAQFLEQNRLGSEQEEVYKRAIQQFPDRSWYHKLARFYLRQRRNSEYDQLSRQIIKIFSGTELEAYFSQVAAPELYYRSLNEFAHARFPHDLVFVNNLIGSYGWNATATERLLREHWWESERLRNQFFELLSRTGRLEQELASLKKTEEAAQRADWQQLASRNPVAARFIGETGFWASHYEDAAPVMNALAQQYPGDVELGHRTSAVFRSLAAFDPRDTEVAVAIEENLYKSNPGDRGSLARIGDVLADRELFTRASQYWERMTTVRPGEPQAYLDPATVYWDYYDFDSALRLLNEGRAKLNNPALYSYEAGAIYEGKREYPQAIAEYLKGALAEHEGSRSRSRLLDLARRPSHHDEVDAATMALADGSSPDIEAVKLRLAVLETQNRPKDIAALLAGVGARTSSLELLEWLEETARQKSLDAVQQSVLERQAAVATDPIRRLELRYSLVRFYEGKKDLQSAQRNVDALYKENSKTLGVVRATVDFYWRNKDRNRAIDVLSQAANDSYPALRTKFRFEAARKATEAAQYDRARKFLSQLLADAPYNDEYLAAVADTYAKADDDQGLKAFYTTKIDEFRKAQLPQDVRTRQAAALRRGLIPALTRLKDYAGAVDQYIELINRFPEDDSLVSEAALYAQRNARGQQLVNYYQNTAKQSPRDYRWPMVLAKTQAQMEDYPAAIETYASAIRIRPDRVDLHTARGELLERLMRFDEAVDEYTKLFDLNYHDTKWMERVALTRARQGDVAKTVSALRTALIENRPEKPELYFEAARRLQSWGMLTQARDFAEKGVDLSGRDLLAVSDHHSGAQLYVEILTRLRQQDAAYARLQRAVADADSVGANVSVAITQVEKNGLGSITDGRWRARAIEARVEAAHAGLTASMRTMGSTVNRYFTPEERANFAASLESKASGAKETEIESVFLPAAASAELPDLEARWNERLLMAHKVTAGRLIELQSHRMRFEELGAALDHYADTVTVTNGRDGALIEAASAYRSGALYQAELNVLSKVQRRMGGTVQQRYFQLLLQQRPETLVELAGDSDVRLANDATQFAVRHGDSKLAQQAIVSRSRSVSPLWRNCYAALTGFYFADRSPAQKERFVSALGDATIGERVSHPVDRESQLAGSTWFYYGSRYGEWLGTFGTGDPEDFVPAILEQSPATASGYVTVAEYYSDAGKLNRAIDDYSRTLELAPRRADIHDRIAILYWRQQKKAEAIAEWKQSLEMLDEQVNGRGVPASFWETLGYVLNHIGNRHLLGELRPQADKVLRDYVRHNGSYESESLLRAAYLATGEPNAGVAWLLDLASVAPEPKSMLTSFARAEWIPRSAREPIYQRVIANLQEQLQSTQGLAREFAEQDLQSWQLNYAADLVQLKQFDRAAAVLQAMSKHTPTPGELELHFRIAIAQNEFESELASFRTKPDEAPSAEVLRTAARGLQSAGLSAEARKIFEFVFAQEIEAHKLTSANMLGLAEIRLEDGDTAGAMELLHRLTLVVGQPFENLDPAAALLTRTGHHAEAVEFLTQLAKATPWDTSVRLRLAQERVAAGIDSSGANASARALAADSQAMYGVRVDAATLLAGGSASGLGSAELDLLASGNRDTSAADKPYFFAARLISAEKASTPEMREKILRSALNDAPKQDVARTPLFYALVQLGHDQLALSAIEPLLSKGFLQLGSARPSSSEVGAEDEEVQESEPYSGNEASRPPVATVKATAIDKVMLASAVAASNAKLNELETALRYYRSARAMDGSEPKRAEIDQNTARLRSAIRRNATNKRRAPMIHGELEQENVVRPKLVASVKSPPAKAQNVKGGR
jgi:predicted Zn-dependent protease